MDELIRRQLESFLREDLARGDLTSEVLIDSAAQATARVVCRERGIVAGLHECTLLAQLSGLFVEPELGDGDPVRAGGVVLRLLGSARALLGVERTLLNVLGHLSGVSTATANAVAAVKGTGVRIAATRKTLPGLRLLQKRAVVLGGGDGHRLDLADAVLIKDNHRALSGSLAQLVRTARAAMSFTRKVEVEVESPADAVEAARAGADAVLLENISPQCVQQSVEALLEAGLRRKVLVEASGRITPKTARAYADAGADIVSIGALTASAITLDYAMEIQGAAGRTVRGPSDGRRLKVRER